MNNIIPLNVGIEMFIWTDTVLDYIIVSCIISNGFRYNLILLQPSISFHIETVTVFAQQIKWLVSIINATLGWNRLTLLNVIYASLFQSE